MKKWYNPEEYSVEQMKYKLSILKEFQDKYRNSHVGGSVGLYLHGIDLKRDISKTDLDITVPDWIDDLITIETGVRPEPKKLKLKGLDLPF